MMGGEFIIADRGSASDPVRNYGLKVFRSGKPSGGSFRASLQEDARIGDGVHAWGESPWTIEIMRRRVVVNGGPYGFMGNQESRVRNCAGRF